MALYAFDGRWNEDKEQSIEDTNVVKFQDPYTGKNKHYLSGVGTRLGKIGQILGRGFGTGGKQHIDEM